MFYDQFIFPAIKISAKRELAESKALEKAISSLALTGENKSLEPLFDRNTSSRLFLIHSCQLFGVSDLASHYRSFLEVAALQGRSAGQFKLKIWTIGQ